MGKLGCDLLLGAAQHEGAQPTVQTRLCDRVTMLFDRGAKQFLKPLPIPQKARIPPVDQRPKVLQRVFQRRAGQRQPPLGRNVAQALGHLRGRVLEGLRFVQDHQRPLCRCQPVMVARQQRIGGDDQIGVQSLLAQRRPACAMQDHEAKIRSELRGLHLPAMQQAGRNDQKRPVSCACFATCLQKGQHLNCLAQPHIIGQDPAKTGFEQAAHPGGTIGLIGAQLRAQSLWWSKTLGLGQCLQATSQRNDPGVIGEVYRAACQRLFCQPSDIGIRRVQRAQLGIMRQHQME